jgi:hypothetical protein
MSVVSTTSDSTQTLIEDLRELVAALDRRVPRLERAGETAIARDALHLRDEAVARLATLEKA